MANATTKENDDQSIIKGIRMELILPVSVNYILKDLVKKENICANNVIIQLILDSAASFFAHEIGFKEE